VLISDAGYDIYRDDMSDDLQRYYDRYAKGIKNGWEETTPPVRLSLLAFEGGGGAGKTILERPESSWPLEREEARTFYLDSKTGTLVKERPAHESSVTYEAHHLTDSAVSTRSSNKLIVTDTRAPRTLNWSLTSRPSSQAIPKPPCGYLRPITTIWM
jgi:hypothetical protein